jgi:hypothetical protein
MLKDLVESSEEFANQFNRDSTTFHGGDATPVRLDGVHNIPEGMKGQVYPDVDPNVPQPTYFGPEAERIEKLRNDLGDLKKHLVSVNVPNEAILRNKAKLAGADETQTEKIKQLIRAEEAKREQIVNTVQEIINRDVFNTEEARRKTINELLDKSKQEFNSQEELYEFGAIVKRESQQIFNEQKKLLQQLKDAKKQWLSNPENPTSKNE